MPSDRQLLILGNGFDLQCKLESSFKNFVDYRQGLIDEANDRKNTVIVPIEITLPNGFKEERDAASAFLYNEKLTIWDIVFKKDRPQQTWNDIENCLQEWVSYRSTPAHTTGKRPIQQICKAFKNKSDADAMVNSINDFFLHPIEGVSIFAREIYDWDGQEGTLLDIFLDQLHRYEQEFAFYLQEQANGSEYRDSAARLLEQLVEDEYMSENDSSQNRHPGNMGAIDILNFNYTNPIPEADKGKYRCHNIHGLADRENIIFGIDGTQLNPGMQHYDKIIKFSKAYRILALYNSFALSPLFKYDAGSQNSQIGVIKFYGHSLDEADYPYFHAIFDAIDLYASNTRLIFYYNEKPQGRENAQEEMFEKVIRLITAYGQTLDNADHGKHMLVNLILDGRLVLKQMP